MLRLLSDQNFRASIIDGLLRREPGVDIIRVQDIGLARAPDPVILEHAAHEGRILLTHDLATMPAYAHARVRQGLPMPGVFAMSQSLPVRRAIEDLLILIMCSRDGEWEN